MRSRPFRTLIALAAASMVSTPALAIDVDGRIDPAEWQGAQLVTDFRITQPLTGAPGSQPTEAWILATPEGLAIGFVFYCALMLLAGRAREVSAMAWALGALFLAHLLTR